MNPKKPLEDLFSARQVAAKLGLHPQVVRAKIAKGEISPIVRLNSRTLRVPLSTLNAYIASRTLNISPGSADA